MNKQIYKFITKYQLFTITEFPVMQQNVILGDYPNTHRGKLRFSINYIAYDQHT